MSSPSSKPIASKPIIIRLPNYVGDVVLAIASIERIVAAGFAPILIGKRWAKDLLAPYCDPANPRTPAWQVHEYPSTTRARMALLRQLAKAAETSDSSFRRRVNALSFPNSFSSALELRLAGLRAVGFAREARSLLLARAPKRVGIIHEQTAFWQLASTFLGVGAPAPQFSSFSVNPSERKKVAALLQAQGIEDDFICIIPFAGGLFRGQSKLWPHFTEMVNRLAKYGLPVVMCPAQNEAADARAQFPQAISLQLGLASYAALLERAKLVISNDTGPGHIAAALGVPLLSILGATPALEYAPLGKNVRVLQNEHGWVDVDTVVKATNEILKPSCRQALNLK